MEAFDEKQYRPAETIYKSGTLSANDDTATNKANDLLFGGSSLEIPFGFG